MLKISWNPLDSRRGRLLAFFLLYVTEGIPLGFTATTVATYMRQEGVDAGKVAMFVGLLYLPWSWKWVMGPVVDCIRPRRLGARRGWILGAQTLMALTLMGGLGLDPAIQFQAFIGLVLVVNVFGALQDVAIDALAVAVLPEDERGLANGLMFAGAYGGMAVGGSLMLYLIALGVPFSLTFLIVPALVLAVTIGIGLPMREPPDPEADADTTSLWRRLRSSPPAAWRAFSGSRNARLALVFAALPAGGYALSLVLQTTLSVEFGLTEASIATLALCSTLVSGVCCAIGGRCSDIWGRRRVLGATIVLMCIPGLVLAAWMLKEQWVMPVDMQAEDRREASRTLVLVFWIAALSYAAFNGFMYGIRTALFMDVCTPAVAATQFTAYMAILNLVITYTAFWQGAMIDSLGYPMTLLVDSMAGLLCLVPLALMRGVGTSNAPAIPSSDRRPD